MGNEKKLPSKINSKKFRHNVTNTTLPIGLPQPLELEEKKFLLAVERGDIANVRRILQRAHRHHHININCMDLLGRRALTLAIDNENLEMVELLVIMGIETKDALLHAINAEFVEAVELLLEHEELIYKEGQLYSWQKVDTNIAMFPPDITPLILAAHKNNYEILKLLLDRGAAVPVPHDIKCGCEECLRMSSEDALRHSLCRVNTYKALASPSLICLTSNDPILTAFELSWELRNLAFTEQECKYEYMELRRQCQKFAIDLLDQIRTSNELAIILNYDPERSSYQAGDRMSLNRLTQAIYFKQKRFVSHSNIQQLLAAIWYEGLPGFRRMSLMEKFRCIVKVAILFPLYCVIYMLAPYCKMGMLMRKPFMKFLIHASSYLFFLFILILVSQRADDNLISLMGTERMKKELAEEQLRQRGKKPTKLELLVVLYLFGFIWEEFEEITTVGIKSYLRNMWNFIDFLRNSLYLSVICLRIYAYIQQVREISYDPQMVYVPREKWDDFDPQLIAEGLFAAANVFSALKLVHMFSINPHLGPLQISLGRMVIDIVKFFSIYSLVLFAFACGLNQLLWYFADLERNKCYALPNGEADLSNNSDSCMKWRRFGNLFESCQSLFWASFGMIGLDDFELTGIKSYTRFWGLLMFGSYSVINVIVLLNLLIAMMSNSYAMIDEDSDTEWKFARTKLWMSYFEDSVTLPPPFNILPSAQWILCLFRRSGKEIDRNIYKKRQAEGNENVYHDIMRTLVWRYVAAQHRNFETNPVTEDDINEVKSEISTMRYEMLEVFESSGLDVSSINKKDKPCRSKNSKVWERQLMKGFQVVPVQNINDYMNDDEEMKEVTIEKRPSRPEGETPIERFRRVARKVAAKSSSRKWTIVLQGTLKNSQIGRCNQEGYKNLECLGRAINEAKRLIEQAPQAANGRDSPIPIEFEDEKTATLNELLNLIAEGIKDTPHQKAKVDAVKKQILQSKIFKHNAQQNISTNSGPNRYFDEMSRIRQQSPLKAMANDADKKTKRELPLSEVTLGKQSSVSLKKLAPPPPQKLTKDQTKRNTFAIEMGQAKYCPGFGNLPKNFDINFVDLNDNGSPTQSMDDLSDACSTGYITPSMKKD